MHFNIIGAGLAGLSAAIHLKRAGHTFTILEASDRAGGRIKTDKLDGYILDHGFQIFLPTYPEAKAIMDYGKLDLQFFDPGALVLMENGLKTKVKDPLRDPSSLFSTLTSPIGSFSDKFKMLSLKSIAKSSSSDISFQSNQQSSIDFLEDAGFSTQVINSFFKPFFSGVFFENDLETSAEIFKFLYNQFSISKASIPKNGMEALIQNLLDQIPEETIHYNEKATAFQKAAVTCESGNKYPADKCIIATEANQLLDGLSFNFNNKKKYSCTFYFSAEKAPFDDALISINALRNKAFNNLVILSNISKAYAPTGKSLIAISTNFSKELFSKDDILKQCRNWFGTEVSSWTFLKDYEIPYSLPNQKKVRGTYNLEDCKINSQLYVCGDHLLYGSTNAALKSGRLTASFASKDV